MKLQIKVISDKIGKDIPLPYYATEGAAGLDLHACIDGPVVVPAGGEAFISTGIAAAIPEGWASWRYAAAWASATGLP